LLWVSPPDPIALCVPASAARQWSPHRELSSGVSLSRYVGQTSDCRLSQYQFPRLTVRPPTRLHGLISRTHRSMKTLEHLEQGLHTIEVLAASVNQPQVKALSPASIPGQVMWILWWTKRHWGRFSSTFPLPILIPPTAPHSSTASVI
jgi:hypothetical protein